MRNKVTLEEIEARIIKEDFQKVGTKMTICLLTLDNGFEIVGVSGCVDAANFNFEIGSAIARANALDQLWKVEGYLLQEDIHRAR